MSYPDREPRKSVELDVQMKDFSFIKTSDESSVNMSLGGAFIRMDDPYPSGTLIKFQIRTPDEKVIEGVGKVAWLRKQETEGAAPSGVGIKFIKMSDDGRQALEKVLEGAEMIISEPSSAPPDKDTLNLRPRSSVPPAPPKDSTPPEEPAETSPAAKVFEAIKVKASQAPAARTSAPPAAIPSAPPAARISAPPESSQVEEKRPSDAPIGGPTFSAKKTETISFPPKFEFSSKSTPPAEPSSVQADAASSPSQAPKAGRDSEPMALTTSMKKDRPEETESADPPATTSSKPAAGGATRNKVVMGVVAAAAILVVALMFLGKGDPQPETSSESTAKPHETTSAAEPVSSAPRAPVEEKKAEVAKPVQQEAPAPIGAETKPEEASAPASAQAATESNTKPETAPAPAVETVQMELVTSPEGATVTVNGKPQEGVTPLKLALEKGKESVVTAHVAGYLTQTESLTPSEETPSVEWKLSPARIKFQITSKPAGARILIDGKFNGTTPYTFLRKKYKPDYQYKLERKGFEPIEGTIAEDAWVEDGKYYVFTLDAELKAK